MFGGGSGGRRAGGPFGGGGFGRNAPPQKGANVAYRLAVEFIDAAMLAPQRITLQDGKSIELKLPNGVEDGTQMRLAGRGQPGPGGPGDATITITIRPHAFFKRDGDNVLLDLPITIKEAAQGGKIKLPTVEGPVNMGIPAGSVSGKTLRLKGRGFTGKDGQRGDHVLLAPPYITAPGEIDEIVDILGEAVDAAIASSH